MGGRSTYLTRAARHPEATALYRVVQGNLLTLYAAAEQGFAAPLPGFVKAELERYVDCGVLARGFSVLACPDCQRRRVQPLRARAGAPRR